VAAGLVAEGRREGPSPRGPALAVVDQPEKGPEPEAKPPEKTRELPVAGEGIVQVTALSFARGGKALLTAGIKSRDAEEGGVVVHWDTATGKRLAAPLRLPKGFQADEFSPDGKRATIVKGMGEAHSLVDLATGKEVKLGEHAMGHVRTFSPDGKAVVTCSAAASSRQVYSELKVWDAATGKLRFEKDGSGRSNEKAYYSAEYSPDGKNLLVTRGGAKTPVELIDAGNGKELASLGGAGPGIPRAIFSPDGKSAAAWSSETKVVTLFDVAKRKATILKGHAGHVRAAAFTPDSKALVTAGLDGMARVWDLKTGKGRMTMPLSAEGKRTSANWLTLSPDGRLLVVVGREARPVARVWELATGKELETLAGATQVVFSPDGKTLAVAVGGSRWDVGGGFGFGPGAGKKKKETPDKVRLVPVAELLKGGEKRPVMKD
jgi:WD40 repeat protein